MKKFFFFLIPLISLAQTNTEIHLFDISNKENKWTVSNGKNISNNEGYDSQPHFYDENTILFSSTRNNQTDVAKYTISTGKTAYINNTPNGGEYSPQRIPGSKNISAVRLDTDGKQRFYEYDFTSGKDKELIQDLVIAYPMWYNQNIIVSSVIVKDSLNLVVSYLKTKINTTIAKNTGRSFHKIPNSNLISFMEKDGYLWNVYSLDPITRHIHKIMYVYEGVQDICWLPNGLLLSSLGSTIFKFDPKKDKRWSVFHEFENEDINNITRITVNKKGTKLAITAEVSPKHIVQKQLNAYNNRDLEKYISAFTENVKVYTGLEKLEFQNKRVFKFNIGEVMANTKRHHKLIKRYVRDNTVIDEYLTTLTKFDKKKITSTSIVIYQITNGKISSIRFL